jgi:hypothetical protein
VISGVIGSYQLPIARRAFATPPAAAGPPARAQKPSVAVRAERDCLRVCRFLSGTAPACVCRFALAFAHATQGSVRIHARYAAFGSCPRFSRCGSLRPMSFTEYFRGRVYLRSCQLVIMGVCVTAKMLILYRACLLPNLPAVPKRVSCLRVTLRVPPSSRRAATPSHTRRGVCL